MMSLDVIDERRLPEFRAARLAPGTVLDQLPGPDGVLLFNDPPGVGKTTLGKALIPSALAADHNLVIFVAPTRALIAELPPALELGCKPEEVVVLERRPRERCGPLDADWSTLETSGCAALAKATLCETCPHQETCQWPDQMEHVNSSTRLIVFTEQYLVLNPNLIPALVARTKADSVLVILDEALFLTQSLTRRITRCELERFRSALGAASVDHGLGQQAVARWLGNLDFLLDDDVSVDDLPRFWPGGLEHAVLAVQQAGRDLFGSAYRHLAADLSLLNSRVTTGQWRRDGAFEVAVGVDLGQAQCVVLGPYLDADLVEERLHRTVTIANPAQVFRHSGTRVVNISDSIGSARSLGHAPHRCRVVDRFFALALRNARVGKRTVLVAKKQFLDAIRTRFDDLSALTGEPLRIVAADALDHPDALGPRDIVLINYGIVGVNGLKGFDAIYCIGSFHIREGHLSAVYYRDLPPDRRSALRLRSHGRRRRVESADGSFHSRYHAGRARSLHRTLERRVVLQAVGRARPFTSSTEVILFQQEAFEDVLGEVTEFATIGQFRDAWNIPTAAEIARSALGDRLRPLLDEGMTYRAAADRFGVSASTIHKAALMPPLDDLLGRIGS